MKNLESASANVQTSSNQRTAFPIAEVIEEVLQEKGISYKPFGVKGGFDVRGTRGYAIKLLRTKAVSGIRRFLGMTNLTVTFGDLIKEINQRYFRKFEPAVLKNRPDLAEPSILTDRYARFAVSSPCGSTDPLDVAVVKVVGYA